MDLIEKTDNAQRHPWELSRSKNILALLKNMDRSTVYADVGSGDRFFTEKIKLITDAEVYAVDSEYPNARSIENGIVCLNDIALLKDASIDCLVMMDVLEHIEDEQTFLSAILKKLKPGGKVVVTVPAIQMLFSSHDAFLKHYRRYSRKRLVGALRKQNLKVEFSHYFYTSLMVARAFTCLREKIFPPKKNVGVGSWKRDDKHPVTRIIAGVLNLDFAVGRLLNRILIRIPGLSLVAVCRKEA